MKRKVLERFPVFFNNRFIDKDVSFAFSDKLPKPIFERREGAFREKGKSSKQFELTFLNQSRSFLLPINWHEEELEYGTRLWKLNLHYMEFLEELEDDWLRWIIRDWIKQNPPYKKGYWLDSWNSFALSIRIVVWMQQLAVREDQLPNNFVQKSSESIYRQLLFLEKNIEKDIKGNHLIKNIKALLWGASFFEDDNNVKRWRSKGEKMLWEELKEQILDDGLHYERSPAYHCQVLADLLECYIVLPEEPLKGKLETELHKMGEALINVIHPDERISLFNDGGLDMAYPPLELIQVIEKHIEFSHNQNTQIALKDAGYYGLRKDGSYLLFDAGKIAPDFLPAHGHGDIFSFEWTINDQRIFIDKGVYEYNAGERRELSRSTRSHNTVTIANKDQCEFWHSFRVAKRANVQVLDLSQSDDSFGITAKHDGFTRLKGGPVHQRTLRFDGKGLLIEDFIKSGAGQEANARFLLHPDVQVQDLGNKLSLAVNDVELHFSTNLEFKLQPTSWYPNFGVEEACKQIVVNIGEVPCSGKYKMEVI
jgi:uncharacterized heparinase superfamily protein